MLRSLLVSLLVFVPQLHAGDADAGRMLDHDGHTIICERLLDSKTAKRGIRSIEDAILLRPYTIHFLHDMTPAGLKAFGLVPEHRDELRNLVLVASANRTNGITISLYSFRGGRFLAEFEMEFGETPLKLYETTAVPAHDFNLPYAQLAKTYPPDGSGFVGFHSKPDRNGVRHFVTFNPEPMEGDGTSSAVQFGIDVPFDDSETYSADIGELTDDLRTPEGRYRRLPVFGFGRLELNPE